MENVFVNLMEYIVCPEKKETVDKMRGILLKLSFIDTNWHYLLHNCVLFLIIQRKQN